MGKNHSGFGLAHGVNIFFHCVVSGQYRRADSFGRQKQIYELRNGLQEYRNGIPLPKSDRTKGAGY
ncbi:hypothetical protein SDC9_127499 [bioreactor metagenome]|uniref:Uncharacterized protein n=1 Tax=bioreactor metagenome TaxID=1076179 RepID=A0A645CUR7_9ZZZZ